MSVQTTQGPSLTNTRRVAIVLIALMLAVKLLALFTAPVHQDDNYYLNLGKTFFERGTLSYHMWRLDDTGMIGGGGTGYGVLLLIGWFRAFGLSDLSGRLFSFTAGLFALGVLFITARRWQGERTALFATVFAAASGSFFINFYARLDAIATLAYTLVLLLHVNAVQQQRAWLHFAVGLAVIAAAEFHTLALCYAVGLSFYYLYAAIRQLRSRSGLPRDALAFFVGVLLAGGLYLAIHVLPNVQQYLLVPSHCPLCAPFGSRREAMRLIEFFVHFPVETILFALALVAAFRRRSDASRHYALIAIGALVGLMAFTPSPQVEYSGHLWPLMAVGVGLLLAQGIRRGDFFARNGSFIQLCVVGILLILHLVRQPFVPVTPIRADVLAYLRDHVATETVVMGSVQTYYQLLDYPEFMSYHDDERYGLALRGEDYLTYWRREQPKVFVGDPGADAELRAYMAEEQFAEVLPGLWVAPGVGSAG